MRNKFVKLDLFQLLKSIQEIPNQVWNDKQKLEIKKGS